MAEFVIRLADERGHVQEQIESAATAEELRARFSQAGYFVYSVKPRGLTGTARKTKLETFLIFNQQILTLIRAGMPILGSLEMLAKSQKNANFAGQLQNVAARVRTGEPISNAFEAQGAFPLMYTTTLLAGERAGNLEEVLGRYMSFQRVALAFRKKLTASLIYPMLSCAARKPGRGAAAEPVPSLLLDEARDDPSAVLDCPLQAASSPDRASTTGS